MIDFVLKLFGTEPLLMHSSRLANPLDDAAKAVKAVTSKRKKTDEDHEKIAYLEFLGGMYFDPQVGPYIPGENIMRCLVDGGKLTKQGTAITRGVIIKDQVNALAYDGPRNQDDLWAAKFYDMSSSKVGMQRVMRTRPMFRTWSVQATGMVDPSVLELTDIETIATNAGLMVGLGDWRPRYGRFSVEVTKK